VPPINFEPQMMRQKQMMNLRCNFFCTADFQALYLSKLNVGPSSNENLKVMKLHLAAKTKHNDFTVIFYLGKLTFVFSSPKTT